MNEYEHSNPPPMGLVREMDELERPREKALAYGLDTLSDVELMAIIFATGIKGKGVVKMCEEILEENGGHLSMLARKSVDDLVGAHKGIGKVKALTLLTALKLGERTVRDANKINNSMPIRSAVDAYNYMKQHFMWLNQEEFWVLYLNRAGKPIKELKVSIGTTAFTTADIKVIIKNALNCMANSMLLFHNHPSGQLKPSPEDDRLTKKITQAAELFEIHVFDHLIMTDSGFYSYNEQSRL